MPSAHALSGKARAAFELLQTTCPQHIVWAPGSIRPSSAGPALPDPGRAPRATLLSPFSKFMENGLSRVARGALPGSGSAGPADEGLMLPGAQTMCCGQVV